MARSRHERAAGPPGVWNRTGPRLRTPSPSCPKRPPHRPAPLSMPTFEIYRDDDGRYRRRLRADDGRLLARERPLARRPRSQDAGPDKESGEEWEEDAREASGREADAGRAGRPSAEERGQEGE